jgi:hypothetical protein
MQALQERQTVVDRSTLGDIDGAVAADEDTAQVIAARRKADGGTENVTLYFPAGIKIVKRR